MTRGFHALARRYGVPVVLPSGATVQGLYDQSTKAERIGKGDALILAGRPSVVLETVPGLGVDAPLTVQGRRLYVRDHEAEGDGALTRYFLSEDA